MKRTTVSGYGLNGRGGEEPAGEMESRIKSSEEVRQAEANYGPGSVYWTTGTALTAALSGGMGGKLSGAVSGAAAPYLANLVKGVSGGNEPMRVALHTVLGAFLAQSQGGSVSGGALGGFTASAASGLIAKALYPEAHELTVEQKQLVANLVMIAGAGVGGVAGGNLTAAGSAANTAKNEVENNSLAITCEHELTACAKNPWLEGGVGPGGLAGGAAAAGVGAAVGEALNGDKDKTAQDGDQPNVGKNLTDGEKTELGGTGSGTPGGWGPEDEENARNQDNSSSKAEEKFNQNDLISSANKPINDQGMSAAARAWEKHAGRQGGTFEPLKGNVSQKNEAANQFVTEVLNNPNTVRTELSRGGVEFRSPDGKGVRYNGDGSFSGFLDPKR